MTHSVRAPAGFGLYSAQRCTQLLKIALFIKWSYSFGFSGPAFEASIVAGYLLLPLAAWLIIQSLSRLTYLYQARHKALEPAQPTFSAPLSLTWLSLSCLILVVVQHCFRPAYPMGGQAFALVALIPALIVLAVKPYASFLSIQSWQVLSIYFNIAAGIALAVSKPSFFGDTVPLALTLLSWTLDHLIRPAGLFPNVSARLDVLLDPKLQSSVATPLSTYWLVGLFFMLSGLQLMPGSIRVAFCAYIIAEVIWDAMSIVFVAVRACADYLTTLCQSVVIFDADQTSGILTSSRVHGGLLQAQTYALAVWAISLKVAFSLLELVVVQYSSFLPNLQSVKALLPIYFTLKLLQIWKRAVANNSSDKSAATPVNFRTVSYAVIINSSIAIAGIYGWLLLEVFKNLGAVQSLFVSMSNRGVKQEKLLFLSELRNALSAVLAALLVLALPWNLSGCAVGFSPLAICAKLIARSILGTVLFLCLDSYLFQLSRPAESNAVAVLAER